MMSDTPLVRLYFPKSVLMTGRKGAWAEAIESLERSYVAQMQAMLDKETQTAIESEADMTDIPKTTVDYARLKTELIYGRSRSGKTTWLLKLARYIFLKTGQRTRWYLGDGGGETITNTGWADPSGFIDLYPYTIRNNPIETSQLICEGYYPEDIMNPKTRLLPPTPEDFAKIGLWVYEGLTAMSDYIMGDKEGGLADRMAKGETLNKDDSFRFQDGSIKVGGNSRTHYGFTQRKMLDLIGRTMRLPSIKYWTAHELKVEDQDYREAIYGPDIVGTKLTPRIGANFGNTIHMHVAHIETERIDEQTKKKVKQMNEQFRAYVRTHFDPDGQTTAKYYANNRMDARVVVKYPDLMPEYLEPADPIRFYGLLDEARRREAELDKEVQDMPDIELVSTTLNPQQTRAINLT